MDRSFVNFIFDTNILKWQQKYSKIEWQIYIYTKGELPSCLRWTLNTVFLCFFVFRFLSSLCLSIFDLLVRHPIDIFRLPFKGFNTNTMHSINNLSFKLFQSCYNSWCFGLSCSFNFHLCLDKKKKKKEKIQRRKPR